MKKMSKNYVLAIAIATLIMAGCTEDVDPASANLRIEMKAKSDLGVINPGGRVSQTGIEFTEARIGVTEIEFELEYEDAYKDDDSDDDDSDDDSDDDDSDDDSDDDDSDDDSDEYEVEYEGQFIVDLLTGTSTPDFGIADLIPGTYTEIEVEMNPVMNDGNSLFIALNYQPDGGNSIAVEISTSRELEFEIEKSSGIKLGVNSINQILILFNFDEMLAGVDLSAAAIDSDGVLRINDTKNTNLTNLIISNFYDSCDAGEDRNDDDKFDDDDD